MDVFLLSAGIGKQNAALQPGIELATAETNVLGFIRMVDTAYAYFREKGGGHLAVAQLARMQRLNIHFTDIRPGFVDTDLLGDDKKYPLLMSPTKVATSIIRAIERRKPVCTIDIRYRILVFFWRLIPRFLWERLPVKN